MADNEQSEATGAEQPQVTEDTGFAEAFAERAERPKGTDEAEAGAADEAAQASADEAGAAEVPAQAAASPDSSGTKAEAFDPYAGMTPELRAHWERVAASERSQRGRVGALTKKLNSQQAPAETRQAAPEQKQEAETGTEQAVASLDDRLKAIAEGDYADVNGPLVEVIADLRKEIASLTPSPNREQPGDAIEADAAEIAKAYEELEQAHPDYRIIGASQEFAEWAGKQPKEVQAMIGSYDAGEVSLALRLFKAEAGPAPKQPGSGSGGNGSTAQDDRRARQMEGSRQPASRGAPAAAGVPNEFGAAFKARAKAISA